MKTCTKCCEVKPLSGFSAHPTTLDGRQSWCRVCAEIGVAASLYRKYRNNPRFMELVQHRGTRAA